MKPISLIAICLSTLMMLLPATANAAKRDKDGYKPRFENSYKGDKGSFRRNGNANKGYRKTNKRSKYYDEPKYRSKKNKAKNKKRYKNKKRKSYSDRRTPTERLKNFYKPKYKTHDYKGYSPRKKSGKSYRKHKKSRKYKRYLKKSLRTFNDFLYDDYLDGCLPPRILRASLIDRGWHDFELMDRGPYRIVLFATSYNGKRYRLVVDACTGRIIRRNYLGRF